MSKSTHELAVTARNEFGGNTGRRARKAGLVPAVVYAKGKKSYGVYVKANEWQILSQQEIGLIDLVDEAGKKTPVLVREVQNNALKSQTVHIDFQAVKANVEIHASVPLRGEGIAIGASRGGVLDQLIHELPVVCLPKDLPEAVTVDISELNVGDQLHVKDIKLPAGVKYVGDEDAIAFMVARQMSEEEAGPETAGEEAAAEPAAE